MDILSSFTVAASGFLTWRAGLTLHRAAHPYHRHLLTTVVLFALCSLVLSVSTVLPLEPAYESLIKFAQKGVILLGLLTVLRLIRFDKWG